MEAVLMSINPKRCELIALGKKTVEVRKTRPKLKTPFKCYIYCTEKDYDKTFCIDKFMHKVFLDGNGKQKVIGEFVCEDITDIRYHEAANGYSVAMLHPLCDYFAESTCLKYEELHNYLQRSNGYGWHISELVIYDAPRELREFSHTQEYINKIRMSVSHWEYGIDDECARPLRKPPQSWCYVEEAYR